MNKELRFIYSQIENAEAYLKMAKLELRRMKE